jgi:putative Holliday junction resolvase
METNRKIETLLSLDVGERRIGVARAHLSVLLPQPLTTLEVPERFIEDILALCQSERAAAVVVGRPRGLNGQETEQTRHVAQFGSRLESQLQIPVYWTDEAVTSAQAEAELRGRGKPYQKGDIDALAATYILEDFIREHPEFRHA